MSNKTDELHKEREAKYGDWVTQSLVAQRIKDAFRYGATYEDAPPAVKEKLDMIANKLSRIVNGDWDHQDSWDDIAGYATLPNKKPEQVFGLNIAPQDPFGYKRLLQEDDELFPVQALQR